MPTVVDMTPTSKFNKLKDGLHSAFVYTATVEELPDVPFGSPKVLKVNGAYPAGTVMKKLIKLVFRGEDGSDAEITGWFQPNYLSKKTIAAFKALTGEAPGPKFTLETLAKKRALALVSDGKLAQLLPAQAKTVANPIVNDHGLTISDDDLPDFA